MRAAALFGRGLLPAGVAAALLAVAGATLVVAVRQERAHAGQHLVVARAERAHAQERLARIALDEREVRERLALYRRLVDLKIVGAEQRLEWAESIARIRERRRLDELRYQIAPRKLLQSLPGKPGSIDSYASTMRVELGLLHEGDLLRFLDDLRASGNAYYAVNQCSIARAQGAPVAASTPRLRAACEIDLITIRDGGSRT